MNKHIMLVALISLFSMLSACATKNLLVDPAKAEITIWEQDKNFSFGSAESEKENSKVAMGAWLANNGGNKIFEFHIQINNLSQESCLIPEDVVVIDSSRVLLSLLSAANALTYYNGMGSAEASSMSSAMSSYSAAQAASGPVYGTATTYGQLYPTPYSSTSTYNYSGQTSYYQQPNYMAQTAANLSMYYALVSYEIQAQTRKYTLLSLRPIETPSNAANRGIVFSLTGQLPIEVRVKACGDEHVMLLDDFKKLKEANKDLILHLPSKSLDASQEDEL